MQAEILKNVRHNFTVNVLDTTFFGFGLGFSSFVAIVPLYIATLTDSSAIIGLIASVQLIGWQLPQVLTSNFVAGLRRYKWVTVWFSANERLPFFPLALVALLLPVLGRDLTLMLSFILLVWQGMGGGLTATAWQMMISKIIPAHRRGVFYGTQSAAGNLMVSVGVVIAGYLLASLPSPQDFALCFLLAGVCLLISWGWLSATREPESQPASETGTNDRRVFVRRLVAILRHDGNFRWFLLGRILAQFAAMSIAFYTIYAVRRFGMNEQTAGLMAGVLTLSQTSASLLLGWLGDRRGHRRMFALGVLFAALGAFSALAAPDASWLYLAFICAGVTNAVLWTNIMALTAEFGAAEARPYYIGLSNTLTAPATLVAPIVGGWLADALGFQATFGLAFACGLAAVGVIGWLVRDPHLAQAPLPVTPAPVGMD